MLNKYWRLDLATSLTMTMKAYLSKLTWSYSKDRFKRLSIKTRWLLIRMSCCCMVIRHGQIDSIHFRVKVRFKMAVSYHHLYVQRLTFHLRLHLINDEFCQQFLYWICNQFLLSNECKTLIAKWNLYIKKWILKTANEFRIKLDL